MARNAATSAGSLPGGIKAFAGSPERWSNANTALMAVNTTIAVYSKRVAIKRAIASDSVRRDLIRDQFEPAYDDAFGTARATTANRAGNKKRPLRLAVGRRTISRDSQSKAGQSSGPLMRLLPSGLYRRLRNFTGSCRWCNQPLAGFHRRSGLGRHRTRPHPNPEGLFSVSLSHRSAED